MLTFLAAVSKAGPLPEGFEESLRRKGRACLPFPPDGVEFSYWRNEAGTVGLGVWCNDTTHPQHTGLMDVRGSSAVTMGGYMFGDGKGTLPGVAAAARDLLRNGKQDQLADLPGAYALAVADGDAGQVDVFNGMMPLETVHHSDGERLSVVGTRGLLVHLVASDRDQPDYELDSLTALISSGHFAAGRTPYRGVGLAPPNGHVRLTPDGVRVRTVSDVLEKMGHDSEPPTAATFDAMADRLLTIASGIGKFGGRIEMGLSGGKDSRVLAAALARAGVEFHLRTGGAEDHPDVVGARQVARVLGMTDDHVVTGPSGGPRPDTLEVDLLQRTCGTLFRNDGMLNAWGSFAFRQQVAPARQVIGQGGEFYRGGWLKNPVNRDGLTPDRARNMLYTKLFRPEPLLRPDARAWYDEFLSSLLVHNDDNLGLQGRMERAFLYTYGWHWAPPGYSRSVVGEHRYYPYCDTQLLRMNYQLPVQARLHEEPHYNLLVRLNEELAYLPFTKYRWGFESYEPTAARRPDTWADRAAIQKTPADKVNWQKTVGLGELREEVETVLFGQEAQNGLFEVIDRAQLEKVFYSREVYASPNTRMLWNLYAASVMLSNQWVQLDPPSRPVHVRTDANWHQVANVALRTFQQTAEWWVDYFQRRAQAWEETMADKELPPEKVAERAETFFGRALEAASERVAERLSSRLGNLEEYTNVDIGTYRPFLANIGLGATGMTAADLLDEDGKDRFAAAIRGDGLDGGALLERLAGDDDFVDLDAEGPVGLGPLVAYPRITRQVVSSFGLRS